MNTRPGLVRSIPFWGLVVGSAASVGFGVWLTVDKLTTMETRLLDGTATNVDVYGGQGWVAFASAFIAAGLIGFVAVLALAASRALVARPVEVVETISWQEEEPDIETSFDEPAPAAASAATSSENENPASPQDENPAAAR
jgi:hypothetical protein